MSLTEQWTDIKDNYEELGAVTTKTFVVPAGKIWMIYGGTAERDVSATLDIELYNETDKLVLKLAQIAAGGTRVSWGGFMSVASVGSTPFAFPAKGTWYIKYTWGATQTSPAVTLVVAES